MTHVIDGPSNISRRGALASTAALGIAIALPNEARADGAIAAVVNTSATRPPIPPFIYGGFLEHIGDLINHSLWSEVLDDRKFYWTVDSRPLPTAPSNGGPPRGVSRKWNPTGADATVTMDASAPYVGQHSPVVHVAGAEPIGIKQTGLAFARKDYVGRIVIAADPGVAVSATLIWGEGARDRQSVETPATRQWSTAPMRFRCGADATNGRLEITGRGSGSFRVGAVSLMPADNIDGFRPDMIALMREMDCKILRMPGGNFISAYDWKNTIGDPDKRPPIMDPVWNAVQPNDVGVDELLNMARLINVQPYWCINTGFGEPRSGAEILEYVNGAATTEWGAKRAANGHPEPWRVKYWNVGNEMYGHWQMGQMQREQYCVKHNLFVDAIRAIDPSIYIAAPGGFADEMTTGQGLPGAPRVEIGSDRDWAFGMFENCMGRFDALQTHAYPRENKHYDLGTGQRVDVQLTLNEWSRAVAQRIQTMADCWNAYKARFPVLNEGKIKVFFDEWAYHFQGDLKSSLAVAMAFHEFYRHTDFIDMAGYTMATAWLDFDRTRSTISAKGRVFQLYNQHFGVIPVAVGGNSPVPAPRYPIGGDQPSVNTGSPTWPLDVSAALTRDRSALVVAVVNATEQARSLQIDVGGFAARRSGRSWRLTGPNLDAQNRVGAAPQITIAERRFNPQGPSLSLAPISVELFEFPAA